MGLAISSSASDNNQSVILQIIDPFKVAVEYGGVNDPWMIKYGKLLAFSATLHAGQTVENMREIMDDFWDKYKEIYNDNWREIRFLHDEQKEEFQLKGIQIHFNLYKRSVFTQRILEALDYNMISRIPSFCWFRLSFPQEASDERINDLRQNVYDNFKNAARYHVEYRMATDGAPEETKRGKLYELEWDITEDTYFFDVRVPSDTYVRSIVSDTFSRKTDRKVESIRLNKNSIETNK